MINAVANGGQAGINNSPIVVNATAQNTSETIIWLFIYGFGSLGFMDFTTVEDR